MSSARPILVEAYHDFNGRSSFVTIGKGDRVRLVDGDGNSCEGNVVTSRERDGRFMFDVSLDKATWQACGAGGVPEALEVLLNFAEGCLDGEIVGEISDYSDGGALRHAATILRKNQGEAQDGWRV